jgi:hypothetical protein
VLFGSLLVEPVERLGERVMNLEAAELPASGPITRVLRLFASRRRLR